MTPAGLRARCYKADRLGCSGDTGCLLGKQNERCLARLACGASLARQLSCRGHHPHQPRPLMQRCPLPPRVQRRPPQGPRHRPEGGEEGLQGECVELLRCNQTLVEQPGKG